MHGYNLLLLFIFKDVRDHCFCMQMYLEVWTSVFSAQIRMLSKFDICRWEQEDWNYGRGHWI